MIDIITHIPDLDAFRLEATGNAINGVLGFAIIDGLLSYNITKIPVYYGENNDSLCLVRLISDEELLVFSAMSSCSRIGTCEDNAYIFDDGGKVIYDSVYDQTPVELEDGTFYTPPLMIGVFA